MKNKNVVKRIAPEQLQGLFLDYANVLCAEELRSMRDVSSYKEHSKEADEEYRCWFDALSGRVEIKGRQDIAGAEVRRRLRRAIIPAYFEPSVRC